MNREVKKYTTKQQITRLMKDNQNLFNMLMQLGQEVQSIGQMTEVTLNILKQVENYPELVEKMQVQLKEHQAKIDAERSEQVAEMPVTAEAVTPETSTLGATKEYITDEDGGGAIDYKIEGID